MAEFEGQSGRGKIQVSQATEADVTRQFIEYGEGNNSGRAPTYAEQWGITAAPPGESLAQGPSVGQLQVEAAQAEARAANPTPVEGRMTVVEETQTVEIPDSELVNYQDDQLNAEQRAKKYQILYGSGQNEKGELRRKLEETEAAFNTAIAQMNMAKTQPQYPQPQFDPNFQQPQFYPHQQATGVDYFDGIGDEDFVDAKRVRKFQQDAQATLAMMYQQNMAAQQQLHQVQNQMLQQRKDAAGLTPAEEFKLMAKHPWISQLPDGPQKVEALLGVFVRPSSTPAPAPTAPTNPVQVAQNVVRKVTYSEPSQPSTTTLTQDAVQSNHDKEMAEAMNSPNIDPMTGKTRAQKMREVAKKYGYQLGDNGMGVIAR